MKTKVYKSASIIPNSGYGLFAKKPIKKGEIIVEFKGKLKYDSDETDNRSTIYFKDGRRLECYPDCLASFSNDPIDFNGNRRKLVKSLKSDKPFYKIHPKAKVNSSIKINDKIHRAFLQATDDIKQYDEIFTHYYFDYWFMQEFTEIGFLEEEEIEKNGFPSNIYIYRGFKKYIDEFYPGNLGLSIDKLNNEIIIKLKDNNSIIAPMKNLDKYNITKI
jgi:SET domain-containing protein